MTEASQARIEIEKAPSRRQIGIARFATAQTPDQVDDAQHQRGDQWSTEKGMSEAAVVGDLQTLDSNAQLLDQLESISGTNDTDPSDDDLNTN